VQSRYLTDPLEGTSLKVTPEIDATQVSLLSPVIEHRNIESGIVLLIYWKALT